MSSSSKEKVDTTLKSIEIHYPQSETRNAHSLKEKLGFMHTLRDIRQIKEVKNAK